MVRPSAIKDRDEYDELARADAVQHAAHVRQRKGGAEGAYKVERGDGGLAHPEGHHYRIGRRPDTWALPRRGHDFPHRADHEDD